ncbi:MAG: DNA mismatch repair protein MutS [Elusimicrobia bacterium]|nr:DNA mismatch repair protein MutS [Elusimicrobiota bacterium]
MQDTAAVLPDTPLMRQYRELKSRQLDTILFFRLGDFYEMFGEDAQTAAPVCGLFLTARQGVPMCGIPHHNHQHYVAKLIKAGYKVAIADQMEEPSKAKKLVSREVTRTVTPGTVIEDELLEPTMTNYLVSLDVDLVGWGAAVIEVSTGEFWATQSLNDQGSRKLKALLSRVRPAEVLCSAKAAESLNLRLEFPSACLTLREHPPVWREDLPAAQPLPGHDGFLFDGTPPAGSPEPRRGSGPQPKAGSAWAGSPTWVNHHLAAAAAQRCLRYLAETRFHLQDLLEPQYRESSAEMQLDETAIRTLELVESSDGNRRHTLWGTLDCCSTPMGSRTLKAWILHPSIDIVEIGRRQNCVVELLDKPDVRGALAQHLREISDLSRVINRLATRQASPRDLGALRDSLARRADIVKLLSENQFCQELADTAAQIEAVSKKLEPCHALLSRALSDKVPVKMSDGTLIRPGYHQELDELKALKSDSHSFLAKLEAHERKVTGIPSLKAGYNSVFGFYLEVTRTHQSKVPARYVRKQTLTTAERYITPELKELENKILNAEDRILRLEARLFEDLRQETVKYHGLVMGLAHLLAEIDVLSALAETASRRDYVRPTVDLGYDLKVVDGRHPALESLMPAGAFVPNNLAIDACDPRIVILTGPNMSGKSTYLRQSALIALMAQIGSFVPAKEASVGVVDKILTRIGAQDALAQGQSTFMVEMRETSHIIKSATVRSLLILDEIGRGTSTFDGISIAWAVLEHLHASYRGQDEDARGPWAFGPRVLFATHYFELTELAQLLEGVVNFNVEAKEWTDATGRTEVVFLHKISEGPADRSYGIHVAALAGLPAGCLARAREILSRLENESASHKLAQARGPGELAPGEEPTLPMFDEHPVLHALRLVNPDSMTPLEGLCALSELKKKL